MKRVIGYRSLCSDGRHVLLSDADGHRPERRAIQSIQSQHHLSTAYILRTRDGFHVVFLDKLNFRDAAWLLANMDWEDKKHSTMGAARGQWVLRATSKGKNRVRFIESIPSEYLRPKSNAHRLFLEKWFNLFIPPNPTFDRATSIPLVRYTPGS